MKEIHKLSGGNVTADSKSNDNEQAAVNPKYQDKFVCPSCNETAEFEYFAVATCCKQGRLILSDNKPIARPRNFEMFRDLEIVDARCQACGDEIKLEKLLKVQRN